MFNFYEFFAGGGMARAGLGKQWNCLFANDFDHKKSEIYRKNWGSSELKTADIKSIITTDLPKGGDLVWGSFPCQDLSLAGGGAGLKGDRSGTFWPFWSLIKSMIKEGRAPKIIVLENVCGTLTSHDGKDFTAICNAFASEGYQYGAIVVDAALFVPQSRPRLFIVGVRADISIPDSLIGKASVANWHPRALMTAYSKLPASSKNGWVWWCLKVPPTRKICLANIIEKNPKSVSWHTPEETEAILNMMSKVNLAKVLAAQKTGKPMVGTIYKRTRIDEDGAKAQRAEIRFDDIAGCLRTPAGGSSRQLIMLVEGKLIKSRLISSRETARLMGLPETYKLPEKYNEAYHLTGDGVAVPVVRYLAAQLFEPILMNKKKILRKAA